jgi:4-hydroxy-3-polyprenylbenzoate decarboxylase
VSDQSIRGFLDRLEERGELLRVEREVDPVFEISAYLTELRRGPAALFERVRGHELPVVGNVLGSRERIASALGTEVGALDALLVDALARPVEPRLVDSGACQEVVVEDPDLASLPVPTFFEHETGPYVTAGAIVARDAQTGRRNWSIARLKLLGGNRAFIGIAPNHHLAVLARAAHARGEKLEIAVTIGNHPALLVAACYYLDLGEDELETAGALLGEPVELACCRSIDLEVPAQCEIVLEGTIDMGEIVDEGPVSEFHGMYETYKTGPVVTFSALTRRADAIYQAVQPGYNPEHVLLGAVAIGATLMRAIARAVPSVRAVAVTEGGSGRLHAVVALGEHRPGDPRKAMFAAWAAVNLVKVVTVVDDDVDVHDPVAVEWALGARMKADRDLVVVPGVRADRAEPLEQDGVIPKLGIDATRRAGDRADFTIAAPPAEVLARVRKDLEGLS